MKPNSTQVGTSSLIWTVVDDSVIIVNTTTSDVHECNAAGSLIWLNLMENCSQKEIVQNLCSTYEIDEKTAHQDMVSFFTELETRKLLPDR